MLVARHAWNVGDIATARSSIAHFLRQRPRDSEARLFEIEILARAGESDEIRARLAGSIDDQSFKRLASSVRVVLFLTHFGYWPRAVRLAYRLFMEHRDAPEAWLCLFGALVNGERVDRESAGMLEIASISPEHAVDVQFESGKARLVVIEPDARLRSIDADAVEPDHPLARALMGKVVGDAIDEGGDNPGVVVAVRHKFVARMQEVAERFQKRFPSSDGLRSVRIRSGGSEAFSAVESELKARYEFVKGELDRYEGGMVPLAVLSRRLNVDILDVAAGIVAEGVRLKVAPGDPVSREAATKARVEKSGRGFVIDSYTFSIAWSLGILDVLQVALGAISISQASLDSIRDRREQHRSLAAHPGGGSIAYRPEGGIQYSERRSEDANKAIEDCDAQLQWLESNATVVPLLISERVPVALADLAKGGAIDVCDALIIAANEGLLYVSDDLPLRKLGTQLGITASTWLHQVLFDAADSGMLELDRYITATAKLCAAGQDYITVSASHLVRAAELDSSDPQLWGSRRDGLLKSIGGKHADITSHVRVVFEALVGVERAKLSELDKQQFMGRLLEAVVRDRQDDASKIINTLAFFASKRKSPLLLGYMRDWSRGHFLLKGTVFERGV
jgi:cellulose synthase operon protein C